ncbi:hypothetical protein AAG570_009591 [Ranatra chinensis]|uniref:Cytochrome b5 domain-containing protein 1 n=1 Tax=Ranatra chinensis TaxID=642074 RepID=A0ABD0YPJ3_9HEMI
MDKLRKPPDDTWKTKYFKLSEVVIHNRPDDCWVILDGIVKDLTPLVRDFKDTREVLPIVALAGKDISHWFDKNGDIRQYVNPLTNLLVPYLPHGPLPHMCDVLMPNTDWSPLPFEPWWKDSSYNVGRITKNCRPVRIMNMGFGQEVALNVCEEDTLEDILARYIPFNENANHYTWKFETRKLKMRKTLEENEIPDRKECFRKLGLPDDLYVPCLQLYYNDDMA